LAPEDGDIRLTKMPEKLQFFAGLPGEFFACRRLLPPELEL
jgi:hypothetical protein